MTIRLVHETPPLIDGKEAWERAHEFPVRREWPWKAIALWTWAFIVCAMVAMCAAAAFGRGMADANVSIAIGPEGL